MSNAKLFLMAAVVLAIGGVLSYSSYEDSEVTGAAVLNKCSDSDGGINIYVSGVVKYIMGRQTYTVSDSCSGTTQVVEAYCYKSKGTTTTKSCSTGYHCTQGACIKTYQCNDGIDNDRDNKTDYPNDPGCSSSTDNDETDTSTNNTNSSS